MLANRSLLLLALRRALHPGLGAAALVLAGALLLFGNGTSGLEVGAENASHIERALARQAMWTALTLLVAPVLAIGAARVVGRWRAGEAAWLAARAAPPRVTLTSTWLGLLAGAAVASLGVALAAEAGVGTDSTPRALRAAGVLRANPCETPAGGAAVRWLSPAPDPFAPGSRARLALDLWAQSGPAAQVTLSVERADGGGRAVVERRLSRAAILEIDLPPGEGELVFTLERVGEGATVVLERPELILLVPAASERLASVELACRLLLALACWTALGLGFGAWMSAPGAVLVLAGAQALVWLAADPSQLWLPAVDLGAALSWVGEGIVPPALAPAAWLGSVAWVALGLGVARLGLARGGGAV